MTNKNGKGKTVLRRVILIVMLLVFVLSMTATAFAENVCSNVQGNTSSSTSFMVSTEPRLLLSDKITLTQTQGTMAAGFTFLSPKIYWSYKIKVQRLMEDGGTITKTYKSDYKKDYTIKLDKSALYRITVTPVSSHDVILHYGLRKMSDTILTVPTWRVSGTGGISACALVFTK